MFAVGTTIRRVLPLLLVLLLALVPGGAAQAGASGDTAMAKKTPKCKLGKNNKKKCRCPQGYKLKKVKKNGKKSFRCKKKADAKPPGDDGTDTGGTDTGGTDTGGTDTGGTDTGGTDTGGTDTGGTDTGGTDTGGTPPPAEPQPVRNDQALEDALKSAAARKYVSSGGYSIYTYNFMADVLGDAAGVTLHSLRYCTFSWYPGFGNSRENFNGAWGVKEGFTRPDQPNLPGLVTGNIYLWREGMPQDQAVDAGVAVYQGDATINVGAGSTWFEGGDFSFKPGQATTDCAQWEE